MIMGPPGSGKSTQAELLAEELQVPYLSTGDLLRSIASEDTTLGKQIKTYQDKGEIVPDDITIDLIKNIVLKDEYRYGYLGEGFPRTLKQAKAMNDLIDQVIYIEIPDTIVTKRLLSRLICPKCGDNYNLLSQPPKIKDVCDHCQTKLINRSDDNEKVILNRLKVFHQTTKPVILFFKNTNKLVTINGEPPVNIVKDNIFNMITGFKKNNE